MAATPDPAQYAHLDVDDDDMTVTRPVVTSDFELTHRTKYLFYAVFIFLLFVMVALPIGSAIYYKDIVVVLLMNILVALACVVSIAVIIFKDSWWHTPIIVSVVLQLVEILLYFILARPQHQSDNYILFVTFVAQLFILGTVAIMGYIITEIRIKNDLVDSSVAIALFVAALVWEVGIMGLYVVWGIYNQNLPQDESDDFTFIFMITDFIGCAVASFNILLLLLSMALMRLNPCNCSCCFTCSPGIQELFVCISFWLRVINAGIVCIVIGWSIAQIGIDIHRFQTNSYVLNALVGDVVVLIGVISNFLIMFILIVIVSEKTDLKISSKNT